MEADEEMKDSEGDFVGRKQRTVAPRCRSSRLLTKSMSSKHFFSDSTVLVRESLRGICALNNSVSLDEENRGEVSQPPRNNFRQSILRASCIPSSVG